jgi:capsular polysaccharide transport system permease protein
VYQSALSSLEQARAEADRQQRYLAVFTTPSVPEDAVYPRRIQNIAMLIVIVVSIWGIGTLIVYSVRDHMS